MKGYLDYRIARLAFLFISIATRIETSGSYNHEDYSGHKFLRQFQLPDFPINVTITNTDPSYYCVQFYGRPGKGLSAEGCAELPELKARGQHFWRVRGSFPPTRLPPCQCAPAAAQVLVANSDPQPAIVVDVGANVGSHASYPAALGARVYAIEPHPYHARRLLHMAHLNEWDMVARRRRRLSPAAAGFPPPPPRAPLPSAAPSCVPLPCCSQCANSPLANDSQRERGAPSSHTSASSSAVPVFRSFGALIRGGMAGAD